MTLRRASIYDEDDKNSCCDGRKFRRLKSNNNNHIRFLYACVATISFIPITQKSNLFAHPKMIVSASSSSTPQPLANGATIQLNKRRPILQFPFLPHRQTLKGDKISCIQRQERSVHKGRITAGTNTNNRDTNIKYTSLTKKKKEQQRKTHKKDHENLWSHSGFYYGIGEEFLKRSLHKNNNTTYYQSSEPKKKKEKKDDEDFKGGEVNKNYGSRSSSTKNEMKKKLTTTDVGPTKVHTDTTASFNSHDIHASNDESYCEVTREQQQAPETFATILRDAVQEFRKATDGIRDDLASLKFEIMELQKLYRRNMYLPPQQEEEQQYYNYDDYDDDDDDDQYSSSDHPSSVASKEKRQRAAMFDHLAIQIENWAKKLIREEGKEEFGWKVVECNKMLRGKYNPDGQTKVYVKWMTDPRDDDPTTKQKQTDQQQIVADVAGSKGNSNTNKNNKELLFPCIKCVGTLDAPIESVCEYLADETRVSEYNDLVVDFRDLEEISFNSKITWTLCPPVLFIKSRDFVTFCSHRWKRDGTQVVVNQAVEHHENAPQAVQKESDGGACRARALRGTNFISPDPDDPLRKTRFTILALADPGGGLPLWAMRAAINAVLPIEPFKLYYKLKTALKSYQPTSRTELVSSPLEGDIASASFRRSSKPAGLAQLGYACFWPKGGGLQENHSHDAPKINNANNMSFLDPFKYPDNLETNIDKFPEDSGFEGNNT